MRRIVHSGGLWLCTLLPAALWASPGPVDQFDCHSDPKTNEYHCHGSDVDAKRSHFLVGAVLPIEGWFYDDGPSNIFAGLGVDVEYGAFSHFAVHSGVQLRAHITGNSEYTLNGYNIGLKVGQNIVRSGTHYYGTAGYYSHTFTEPRGNKHDFAGLLAGVGMITNREDYAFDIRVLWRDSADLSTFWDDAGFPATTTNLALNMAFYLRF